VLGVLRVDHEQLVGTVREDLRIAGTDAAWYYPEPEDAARNIRGHVAFWKDVQVEQ
jgi:uncharacterized protein (DUF427 family)